MTFKPLGAFRSTAETYKSKKLFLQILRVKALLLRTSKSVVVLLLLLSMLPGGVFASRPGNPTQPTSIRAAIYSSTAAELLWNASTDADGIAFYRIYIAGTLFSEAQGPSFYIDRLDPNRHYDVQISAIDRTGKESRWSSVFRLSTSTHNQSQQVDSGDTGQASDVPEVSDAPEIVNVENQIPDTLPAVGVPVDLRLEEATTHTISLSWLSASALPEPFGYNVYLGTSYIATTFNPNYTIRGLEPGRTYRVILTAFDDAGNFSVSSDPLVVTTPSTDTTASDTAESDTAESDTAESDTAESDTAESDTAESGTAESDTAESDTGMNSPTSVIPVVTEPGILPTGTAVVADASITDSNDFFGSSLEADVPVDNSGEIPTAPRHLRANLIGNDWVELNWSPSVDNGEVIAYRIYRDDGQTFLLESTDSSGDVETNTTLDNFWQTTTFVDCNFTHLTICLEPGVTPEVGTLHTYQVSAIDNEGNESPRSNALSVRFHAEQGARVAEFEDPWLDGDDRFLFDVDLSNTANFMDQFELVFADEFEGNEIDQNKWTTSLTWRQEDQNIINGEMQYFVDTQNDSDFGYDPFILNGETLTISAIRTPPELSERALGQPFLSGALSTHHIRSGQFDDNGDLINDKFGTTYGYIEGRIRVGQVPGMLTSFYLFRRWEGQHAPEIDIIEYLGENPFGEEKAFQTYHYRDVNHGNILSSPTMFFPREDGHFGDVSDLENFHTYSVLWEPGLVVWYIDGQEVQRLTGRQIARQSMNIILYLVTGSAWAPRPADDAPFPLEIEIDYIRAYKRLPWRG